ncbi:MAG: TolC family protein [Campylobacteraceae bacterium]|nr:TolC family protein [Campylobacteraceae bacterium]
MRIVSKFLMVLIFLLNTLYAKESCILVFSTKVVYPKDKNVFLKRFPKGKIKKYSKYYEFKLDSFKSRKEASKKLQNVRKYYKDAFIINCAKENKEVIIKSPIIREVKKNINGTENIKTILFNQKSQKSRATPLIPANKISFNSQSYHIPLASAKISKLVNRPKIDESKVLEPHEIPKPSKTDESQIYDVLGFTKYVNTLFESNSKAEEIFYQKKIDYILAEIKKDKYNFDVYANGYLRTGSSISAQSGNAPNINGEYTGAGVALNANKILYDGGYGLINRTYDILYKRLADISELSAKDRLLIFGTTIYSNLYVSQEVLRIVKKIYKKQKFITKFIKEGYRQGKNSPLDFIDSKNDLLNLQRLILNTEYQYLNNDYILRHSIKSKSKKPYKLYREKVKLNLDSLTLLQKEAISHSSAIARESNLLKIKETDLLFQKRRRIPEVRFDSYVGYGLSTNKIFSFDNPGSGVYWELGLNFKLPIYNRNDINLNEQKQRLNILKQKAVFSSKQRDILIQVEKSYNGIMRTKKQIEILGEQLSLLKHKLKIAKERYFAGVSPYSSYSDAVKSFLNYEVQLLNMKQKKKQEISILSILVGKRDFYE